MKRSKGDLLLNISFAVALFLFCAGIFTAIMYPVFGGLVKFFSMLLLGELLLLLIFYVMEIIARFSWEHVDEGMVGVGIFFFALGFFSSLGLIIILEADILQLILMEKQN